MYETEIAAKFLEPSKIKEIKPLGIGNINDSFLVHAEGKYVLQRMNTDVFKKPAEVMENIQGVTAHLSRKIRARGGDVMRETLQFLTCPENGTLLYTDREGGAWRMYRFVDNAITLQSAQSLDSAYKAAHTFGRFQAMLSDFDASALYETIPDFHHTEKRWKAFVEAVEQDRANRAREVKALIERAEKLSYLAPTLVRDVESGVLPVRVTHNDTKINNVLFDKETGEGLCVIDLDTVMPATSLYDFGDMVRSGANATDEEDTDLSHVKLDMTYYKAFLRGFIDGVGGTLTKAELSRLALSAKVLTFELAIRFLGDYLNGDVYFSVRKPRHNAERAENQLALALDMEEKYEEMQRALEEVQK